MKYLIAKDNLAIAPHVIIVVHHHSMLQERLDVVSLLVKTFLCKLDVQDSNGQTPLGCAQDKQEE